MLEGEIDVSKSGRVRERFLRGRGNRSKGRLSATRSRKARNSLKGQKGGTEVGVFVNGTRDQTSTAMAILSRRAK